MKFTTARRIVKEPKKHPKELVDRAHEVCRAWHQKVETEQKLIDAFVNAAAAECNKLGLNEAATTMRLQEAREHAARQLKAARQSGYRETKEQWRFGPPPKLPFLFASDSASNVSSENK